MGLYKNERETVRTEHMPRIHEADEIHLRAELLR